VLVEQRRHARLPHGHSDLETGDAWLRDLEQRLADPVPIADAYPFVGHPLDGEVLTEGPRRHRLAPQERLPVPVGVLLVDEHGAVLTAVPDQVRLLISLYGYRRTRRGAPTGCLKNAVRTVRPFHRTSRGVPTLTDSSLMPTPFRLAYERPLSAPSASLNRDPSVY